MQARSVVIALLSCALPLGAATAARGFSEADVRGDYAFSFDGQIVGVGPVAATGMMRADGRGHVPTAVRTIAIAGNARTETFSCTLTVRPDGTGSAVCPMDDPALGAPPVETFDFVIGSKARVFRFVSTTPGIAVLGSGEQQ